MQIGSALNYLDSTAFLGGEPAHRQRPKRQARLLLLARNALPTTAKSCLCRDNTCVISFAEPQVPLDVRHELVPSMPSSPSPRCSAEPLSRNSYPPLKIMLNFTVLCTYIPPAIICTIRHHIFPKELQNSV